jgi:hypothetical protein
MDSSSLFYHLWTGLKILMAAFVAVASTSWGVERELNVYVIPILLFIIVVQIPLMVHSFYQRRRIKRLNQG